MKKHSAPDPFEIPKFLRLTAAQRRANWNAFKPPTPPPTTVPRSSFATLAAIRKAEQEAKRKARIERALARKAVPDRIAAEFAQRDGEFLSVTQFNRIKRELPTAAMRNILKQDWLRDGNHYRRAIVNGVVVRPAVTRFKFDPKPARKPADELSTRLSALGRAQLLKLAKANGVFKPEYEALPNDGLVRMTCGNRLRAIIKRGEQVKWS